jgi:Zn-finger nucleic acid-binding protein
MAEAQAFVCPVCGAFARDGERACRHCQSLLATVRCGRCFELNLPGALHCGGCGHELGLSVAEQTSRLRCPECQLEMKAFTSETGRLYGCEGCGGQMVDHALLRSLLEARESLGHAASMAAPPRANPLQDRVRYRPCPSCHQLMNRHNFAGTSGVVIDVCSLHGSFFEAGELPRVLDFARRGGLSRSRAAANFTTTSRAPLSTTPRSVNATSASDGSLPTITDLLEFVVELLTRR